MFAAESIVVEESKRKEQLANVLIFDFCFDSCETRGIGGCIVNATIIFLPSLCLGC